MVEQSSGTEADGDHAQSGAMPEGCANEQVENAGGAAQRAGLPPFRGQSVPAGNLDLLVEQDEPLELMIELESIAREKMVLLDKLKRPTESWDTVAEHAKAAVSELKILNR